MKRVTITRPDTRVTDEAVADLNREVRAALPGWHVERDRAAHEDVMVYGRDGLPIYSGTLFEATAFVMGARAGFRLAERRAGRLSNEPGACAFCDGRGYHETMSGEADCPRCHGAGRRVG